SAGPRKGREGAREERDGRHDARRQRSAAVPHEGLHGDAEHQEQVQEAEIAPFHRANGRTYPREMAQHQPTDDLLFVAFNGRVFGISRLDGSIVWRWKGKASSFV